MKETTLGHETIGRDTWTANDGARVRERLVRHAAGALVYRIIEIAPSGAVTRKRARVAPGSALWARSWNQGGPR